MRLKYVNVPTIEFDLRNGYFVKIDFTENKETDDYHIEGYIRSKDIKLWSYISSLYNDHFISDKESVKTNIAKYITVLLDIGYFDDYIKQYEYEQKCFNLGNDLLESQRGGD